MLIFCCPPKRASLGRQVVARTYNAEGNMTQDLAAGQACYAARTIAERMWTSLPDRTKDYIAVPKANGYQSLHCTLRLPLVTLDMAIADHASTGREAQIVYSSQPETRDSAQGAGPTLELQIRTQRASSTAEQCIIVGHYHVWFGLV